jgi:putative hydrolase of the HAD superfamily
MSLHGRPHRPESITNELAIKIPASYYAAMPHADTDLVAHIRDLSQPALPVTPALDEPWSSLVARSLPRRPKAVLFDIYGTLFTSASGDIGTTTGSDITPAVAAALELIGRRSGSELSPEELARRFRHEIDRSHETSRAKGIQSPEVDVREIWQRAAAGSSLFENSATVELFALCYEMQSNPVWPMPGAALLLNRLCGEVRMGIVSNAQFYTPLLFPALLESTIHEIGFEAALISFSYEHGFAKPNPLLFSGPLAELADQGIDSSEAVYLGNDMLNDVTTAAAAGCMTILFAGDRRSLRLRTNHVAVQTELPDSVVQTLEQAGSLILGPKEKT